MNERIINAYNLELHRWKDGVLDVEYIAFQTIEEAIEYAERAEAHLVNIYNELLELIHKIHFHKHDHHSYA